MSNTDFLSLNNFNELYKNITILIQNSNNFSIDSNPKYKKILKKLVLSIFNKFNKNNDTVQLNNLAINKCIPFILNIINKENKNKVISYEYSPIISSNNFNENFNLKNNFENQTKEIQSNDFSQDYLKKIEEMENERKKIINNEKKKIEVTENDNNFNNQEEISQSLSNFFVNDEIINKDNKLSKNIFIIDTGTKDKLNVKLNNDNLTKFIVNIENHFPINSKVYIQMLSIHNILNIEELPNFYMYINELNISSQSNNNQFQKMILFSNTSTHNIFSLNCCKYIGNIKKNTDKLTFTFSKNLFKNYDNKTRIIMELLIE